MVLAKLKKVARVSLYVVGVGILVVFTCQQLTSKHFVYSSTRPENNAKVALIGIKGSPGSNSSRKHTLSGTTTLLQDECRSVEPWFSEETKTSRKQVIFYGKPSMHVIKRICMARHWRMTVILNNSASRLKDLTRLVMQDDIFTILITSSKLHHLKLIQDLSNSQNALVSSIRYAFKISGKKKVQLKSFRRAFENHGCSLESARIMPRSFLLDNPQDCIQFFKYAGLREDSWWVLKPSEGYGGEGITMHPNLTQIYREFGTCSERNNEYVVQEYLSNLLLIEKRKFDVRGLVVIAGTTPYFLFYHEGYLRVSVHTFDFKGDRAAHLTNSHVQVMSNDFLPEKHFWSFQRFQEYLDTYHPGQEDFVDNRLVPFIKKIALFILQAGMLTNHSTHAYTCTRIWTV